VNSGDNASLSVVDSGSLRETHALVGKQFLATLFDSIFTGFSSNFSLFPKCEKHREQFEEFFVLFT
jgi:hypothetical protein